MANMSTNRAKQSHTIHLHGEHKKLGDMSVGELARMALEKNQPVGRNLDPDVLRSMTQTDLMLLITSLEREAAKNNGNKKESFIS